MITHTINKVSVLNKLWPFNHKSVNTEQRPASTVWDKATYNAWYEKNVRGHFAVGDLVTLKEIREAEGKIPFHYKISFLNEMWFNVKFDQALTEPLALCCAGLGNTFVNKSPFAMRKLSVQEVALVNLSNIKAQGTA